VSTTPPNQPQEPEREPQSPDDEATEEHDALRNLGEKPRTDEVGETAYSAVPPPLPTTGDPAQGPVQDAVPGSSGQPQQSPYQQQQAPYQQPQQPYGGSGQEQYAGAQQAQHGGAGGPYQAAPPPPPYGQPYGYPGGTMPPGMPPLADWGQRATAFILDNGVAIAAGWIASGSRNNTVEVVFGLIGLAGAVWAIVNAVRAGREGQSYGKRVMGIRLARLSDGQPVGGGLGFLRLFLNWILWVACVIPGVLNLLWPLWDRMNQTWCDKIAKSVVVKTR
jgi:uncharacterized RDD family membrane protein YckC